ncbi:Hsp70 family protein [Erysipelothrix sp. HDW6C]|uniref:Hsp70 family protein n=1 Tax=Erysipelothrix sp. HDW6C TaxID=2714930 RepID=UPI00140AB259|nr:Hsp70 family protein [Erysipelothrix sp. HDW6C]QIK69394.1 Hsp70 family protein [Erysipelothrix sp. HDW6C]
MLIGIDLGTTNCLVSIRKDGKTVLVPNEFNEFLTPTAIHISHNAEITIGKIALEKKIEEPSRTVSLFKRSMGSDLKYKVGDTRYTSLELSSFMIRKLVADVERFTGETVTEAIISVPAYFTDQQRNATRNCGILAGVKVDRIINEPSAAVLTKLDNDKNEGIFVVFDFGGGTLDVTVVDVFDKIVEILTVSGDNALGGSDIDRLIFEDVLNKYPQLRKGGRQIEEIILKKSEKLKIKLSETDCASFQINFSDEVLQYELSKNKLTLICRPLLLRIRKVIASALGDAGYTINDVDDVVCVGGSSKSYIINEYLKQLFQVEINQNVNPDEAIVYGLGEMIAIMNRESGKRDIVITDVCPFSLGTSILGDIFSQIIPKNTTLPVSMTKSYVTVRDNQKKIHFEVLQGDNMIGSLNEKLSSFEVPVTRLPQGEAQVFVTYGYDINGILTIHAVHEKENGKEEVSMTLKTNSFVSDDEIKKSRTKLEKIKPKVYAYSVRQEALLMRLNNASIESSAYQKDIILKLYQDFIECIHNESPKTSVEMERKISQVLNDFDDNKLDVFHLIKDKSRRS